MWDESKHPRNKKGQFAEKNGDALKIELYDKPKYTVVKIPFDFFKHKGGKKATATTSNEEEITIKLPDIQLPFSIGAKWINESVLDLATGEQYAFEDGSTLQDVEIFCGAGTKKIYHDAYKYAHKVGGSPEEWQHAKAIAQLKTDHGTEKAEVHWSQHPKYGKKEFFIKKWINQ